MILATLRILLGKAFGDGPIASMVFEIITFLQEREVLNKGELKTTLIDSFITNFSEMGPGW